MQRLSYYLLTILLSLLPCTLVSANEKRVTVEKIKELKVKAGTSAEVVVAITVAKGFHIQANPAAMPNLIPTTLEFTAPQGLSVMPVAYPKGESYRLKDAKNEILVYGGKVELKAPIEAAAGTKTGRHKVIGKLRYQACNDSICFFPITEKLEFYVRVVAR